MNRRLIRLTALPAVIPVARPARAIAKLTSLSLPALFLASEAFAQGANTLGGRMTAASTDLTAGGGFVLELLGYVLGGAAFLVGFHTIWQHTKNPNGQAKLGYGITSVVVGGAFLAASLFGSFAANTVAGANATNNGTAAQMRFP